MPKPLVERRSRQRGPQGLSLRVQLTAVVVLLGLVPAVVITLWLVPVAYPEAWRSHAPWFLAWIAGLAVVVVVAAIGIARVLVGPLSKVAKELDQIRAADLRPTVQIRHYDGDPREVASVKRSVLSLLRRVEADRDRRTMLLAMLTHDINTSVLAARNVLDLASQGRVAIDREVAAGVARELGTLHGRTQQLIDVLRFDQRELTMQRENLDLRAVVDDAVERARSAVQRDDVSVTVEGEERLWGDHGSLVRAVENLVVNAIRHARTVVAIELADGGVKVKDDGTGFTGSFEALVRPYERGASSATTEPGGLGLYLTRVIAEAHGGGLELETSGPEGSTLALRLRH